MKIFTVEQIRQLDRHTIDNEPVPSIELMERASRTFVKWFVKKFPNTNNRMHVFCGPGNNGGDGLAIARMLSREFYEVSAYVLQISKNTTNDFQTNLKNLKKHRCNLHEIKVDDALPELPAGDVLIDAIFGSGLKRPVEGYWAALIEHLNRQPLSRVAVDIPSGMFADSPSTGVSVHADYTFSFEFPKTGFLFAENFDRAGEWRYESIGLHPRFIHNEETPLHYIDEDMVKPLLKKRKKFDHKGTFGHALLIAGSYGKAGAAVLAARACLRTGAGLLTAHVPASACQILQISIPEAMVLADKNEKVISTIPDDLNPYNSIGVGCGIGTGEASSQAIEQLLQQANSPIVLDADALNILSVKPGLLKNLPAESILTPHPKEFERLFGAASDSFARNRLQREKAQEFSVYLLLKGAHTAIACPDGSCYFNSTGNPGMATAGSGDVLTGILTGLLAQGYSPLNACLLGVYLHGLAGDLAAAEMQQESLLAGDIVNWLGKAYLKLKE